MFYFDSGYLVSACETQMDQLNIPIGFSMCCWLLLFLPLASASNFMCNSNGSVEYLNRLFYMSLTSASFASGLWLVTSYETY